MSNLAGRERVLIRYSEGGVRIDTKPSVVVNGVIEHPFMRLSGPMRRVGELKIEIGEDREIVGIEMSDASHIDHVAVYDEIVRRVEQISGKPYSRMMQDTLKGMKGAFFGHGDN